MQGLNPYGQGPTVVMHGLALNTQVHINHPPATYPSETAPLPVPVGFIAL